MPGETILAVDDLAENLMTIKLGLRKFDYEFITAKSGDRAIELMSEIKPDLILMDIQMPGKDGFETTEIIKSMPGCEDIPIIFLSALRDVENIVRCFESGGVDYIGKPFKNQELIARIETHLKIRRLQKRLEKEHGKMNAILGNVLPESYVSKLKNGERPQTESHNDVVVMFTDFRNFTGISSELGAEKSISHLNRLFFAFDEIVSYFGLERVKTIGDGYFAVAGVNQEIEHAPLRTICAMLKIQDFVRYYNSKTSDTQWQLRIGAQIGSVIAGIIGYQKIAFDVWGTPVNVASRLQSVADTTGLVVTDELFEKVRKSVKLDRSDKKALHNLGNVQIHYLSELSSECPDEFQRLYNELPVESLFWTYSEDSDLLTKLFPNDARNGNFNNKKAQKPD